MTIKTTNGTNGNDTLLNGNAAKPIISVDSLWKVFGKKSERALEEPYRSMTRAEVQEKLNLVEKKR